MSDHDDVLETGHQQPDPLIAVAPVIADKRDLWEHLRAAMTLELATIPVYLTALYSIRPGHNDEAAGIIRSVVMEEMLHMALVANLLNATGGEPAVDDERYVPSYPTALPDSDIHIADRVLEVPLSRLSPESVQRFVRMELPERPDGPPKADGWHTIGQFYDGIELAVDTLCDELGPAAVFDGRPERQLGPQQYSGGAGTLFAIAADDPHETHALARRAIAEIVGQGEGSRGGVMDGDIFDGQPVPAHHFRFKELLYERRYRPGDDPTEEPTGDPIAVDWQAVYPMRDNPSSAQYLDRPEVVAELATFNRTYSMMLSLIQDAVTGNGSALGNAVDLMFELEKQAAVLMAMPSGDGTTTVGTSFEFDSGSSLPSK